MDDALTKAEDALEAGDRDAALDALLDAWRGTRATAFADLIDVVSTDLARGRAPIDTSTDFHAAWMAVEQEGHAADVARLAPGLYADPANTLGVRLERLVSRGPDPRTGRALLAMIEAIPTTSSSNFPIWTRAFKAMPAMLDTSVKDELAGYRKRKPKTTSNFWPKFHAWIDKLMEDLEPPSPLDADTMKRVKAMRTRAAELGKQKVTQAPAAKRTEKTSSPLDMLATARRALEKNDWIDAVENLLAAWGLASGSELTELLERVSKVAPQTMLPVGPPKAAAEAWTALEAKGHAVDIPSLLVELHRAPIVDVEARLARLVARPGDPRMAAFARQIIRTSSANGTRGGYWKSIFDLLARGGDASDSELARRLGENDEQTLGRNLLYNNGPALRRNGARVAPEMQARIEALSHRPALPELEDAINAATAAIPKAQESPEKALMAAIIAAPPDDDGPLLVYADWLTDQGHPRGELIAVQCKLRGELDPVQKKKLLAREKALLKNTAELFRPLADWIAWDRATWTSGTRIERGMLVAMRLNESERMLEHIGNPMLATVREVITSGTVGQSDIVTQLLLHPNLALVRVAGPLGGLQLLALANSPRPLAIEELEIGLDRALNDEARAAIASSRGLPRLRTLRASFWDGDGVMPPWMMRSSFFARLERVYIGFANSGQVPAVAGWIRAMSGLPKQPFLSLAWGGGECTVIDGVVRATNRYEKSDPEWNNALREARAVAKEVVLEGAWPDDARAAVSA